MFTLDCVILNIGNPKIIIMDQISQNLKLLRKKAAITQSQFAEKLGITRASVGAYEEGRARPNYQLLDQICRFYNISIDDMIKRDLSGTTTKRKRIGLDNENTTGKKMRVLAITVDRDDREYIQLVPHKAAAGYMAGYADQEFVEDLPSFRLPVLPEGTYRAFEISGDSMLPILPGSIVIGEYVSDWRQIKDGQACVVVSARDGIVFKRLFNHLTSNNEIILQSDNPSYPPYPIAAEDIIEIWQAKAFISTVFPSPDASIDRLVKMMETIQDEVVKLKAGQ